MVSAFFQVIQNLLIFLYTQQKYSLEIVLSSVPLVIDLDGTLLRSDLLIESAFSFVRAHPFHSFKLLQWLTLGKAHLKEKLARASELSVADLPYDDQVIALIKEERMKGRKIILATASHKIYAEKIAAHLQLFDQVFATEGNVNLSAKNKRDKLVQEFGERGFDYAGNARDDIAVWAAARRAYIVNPERNVESKAKVLGNVERVISPPSPSFKVWTKALRIHQWVKNLLIFVPLFASHQMHHMDLLLQGIVAFICFGLCASSVYVLNDLVDLADDRHHSNKRHRPFASGALSVKTGLFSFPILLMAAFVIALGLLPWQFSGVLFGYYILTLAYSWVLKRKTVIDVIVLALLYTLRVIAGAFALKIDLTFWMLAFSMFIFFSLALVKRYAELRDAKNKGNHEKMKGRGYYPGDLEMISSLGAASGYLSVMVLALYIQDINTVALYQYPQMIWLACPVLMFWISRVWLLTHRGHMHDDPIVFAIKDPVSLVAGFLLGLIFWLAS